MKIKKCPFCDSEATIKGNIVFGGYSIMCLNDKCGAHVFFYGAENNRDENARRWNKRPKTKSE